MNLNRIYGVFWTDAAGVAFWGMHRNGRIARRAAKHYAGVVGFIVDTADVSIWDAPTFRACMNPIADYRNPAQSA